jgi:hypothetical protein
MSLGQSSSDGRCQGEMIDAKGQPADPPPGYVRTADLMASLSLASDVAVGVPAEHAVRSCYIAMHVAEHCQPMSASTCTTPSC